MESDGKKLVTGVAKGTYYYPVPQGLCFFVFSWELCTS